MPRSDTAKAAMITNSKSTDGPGSACRASVGVSINIPSFLVTIARSLKFSALDRLGQTPELCLHPQDFHSTGYLLRRVAALPCWHPSRQLSHWPDCRCRAVVQARVHLPLRYSDRACSVASDDSLRS